MSKTVKKILNFISFAKLYFLVGNTRIAKHIAKEGLEFVRKGKDCIWFPDLNIILDIKKHFDILKCIRLVSQLQRKTNCEFKQTSNGVCIAVIQGCEFNINTSEEIVLLSEIFLDHSYDIALPYKSIVLDVGMNNADSSLYFASKKNVEFVRGYEPFRPTFEAARRNLDLNPGLAAIIEPYNYGLSGREAELECDYSAKNTAGVGLSGILGAKSNIVKEKIKIKSVVHEIVRAGQDFPDHSIVLKVDTEGSEFEMIECLDREKVLEKIDIVILEWHKKSPQVIIEALLKSGFAVFRRNNLNGYTGMLYAFSQRR